MKRDTQTDIQRTSQLYDRIGPVGRFDEKPMLLVFRAQQKPVLLVLRARQKPVLLVLRAQQTA